MSRATYLGRNLSARFASPLPVPTQHVEMLVSADKFQSFRPLLTLTRQSSSYPCPECGYQSAPLLATQGDSLLLSQNLPSANPHPSQTGEPRSTNQDLTQGKQYMS